MADEVPAATGSVGHVGHIETHISMLFFTPDRVYKLLKPLQTAFVDQSTPARRRALAEAETELNRRLAPDVYLGVADLDENDTPADCAIVMRRLPEERRLSALVGAPDFSDALRAVARRVAVFHAGLEPSPEATELAGADGELRRWRANLEEMAPMAGSGVFVQADLDRIGRLASGYVAGRRPLFASRGAAGMAREGHGDLLADDIFVLDDGPRILDCLAFDRELRLGDVLADLAFLVMDVERVAGARSAQALLRWYQEFSNEHHPASLAHFYIAYRALVRAKVGALRHQQGGDGTDLLVARTHMAQCLDHLERARVRLVLVGGGPGTGKTTVAERIGAATGWTVLSSDELRKDISGVGHHERVSDEPDQGIYAPEVTERMYSTLVEEAGALVSMGQSVVLDASWSTDEHRASARRAASDHECALVELECRLPAAVAKERIVRRLAAPWGVSDATPEIVDIMAARHDDWPQAIGIDTSAPPGHVGAVAIRNALGLVAR